jgi:hypothetical protein
MLNVFRCSPKQKEARERVPLRENEAFHADDLFAQGHFQEC